MVRLLQFLPWEDGVPRPDVSAERQTQILDAAVRVFMRQGVDATRMDDIAREAGLSIGGVYWYFKSKDEIVQAIIRQVTERDLAELQRRLAAPGSVRERLETFLLASLDEIEPLRPLLAQCYRLAATDPAIRATVRGRLAAYRTALTAFAEQGIRRGELRPANPGAIATMLVALGEGLDAMFDLQVEDFDLRAAWQEMADLLMDGLAARRVEETKESDV